MSANSFGNIFKWVTFGESHGPAMGVVIDGCPAGVPFSRKILSENLRRRRPGQKTQGKALVSPRGEEDLPEILSGVFENKTLGTPIAVMVRNRDQQSKDYSEIKDSPRVGHADDIWRGKYGHWDYRGGGRASARETVARVIAGSFGQMVCEAMCSLQVFAFVQQIGPLRLSSEDREGMSKDKVREATLNFPSPSQTQELIDLLEGGRNKGESYGGRIQLVVKGVPKFLGQPVFHKLKNEMTSGLMSIGAAVAVEFGAGFELSDSRGSDLHTSMSNPSYGGLRGGMTTGEDMVFRIGFKPTSSIGKVAVSGRHDPCIVPRAVPVVEAMAWSVLADHLLWARLDRLV